MSEADVTKPQPCSLRGQIAALDVGGTFAMAERMLLEDVSEDVIKSRREAMRSTLQSAAHRAKQDTQAIYEIEGGDFLTRAVGFMLVMTCTRVQ